MSAKITPVGVSDTSIDLFESQYPVPHGITYNSYLVSGDAISAVIDSVDASFASQWLENIATAGSTPDYLVVLHLEPDHSGSIADAMEAFPAMKLVASRKAVAMLPQFFPEAADEWKDRITAVDEGDTLNLGGDVELHFLTAPMVHWPEVLVGLEKSTGTLFSADAFGTFGTPGQFSPWYDEAARYYFNICGKYGLQVTSLLKKASSLPINAIMPLHGPALEGGALKEALERYALWAAYKPDIKGVFIPYASIYGNTASAAVTLSLMLEEQGVATTLVDLARCDVSEAVAAAFRHSAMCPACATYDGTMFPPMAAFLSHLAQKGFRNRPVGLIQNGSWAPVAAAVMTKVLETMKGITIIEPQVTIRTRTTEANRTQLRELAAALAKAL